MVTSVSRGVFALLVVSVWINYIDRGTLGVAAPALRPELGLSQTETGYLLSSFFWTYSICLVFSGWLVDRLNVTRFYAAGFLLWSIATLLTGASTGFTSILVLRMLLGIGESVAFPAYSKILALGFPEHRRGFANALIDAGTKAGPALGTFVGGMLVDQFGWRGMFVVLGGISLLWLVPWLLMAPANLAASGGLGRDGPGFGRIMKKREAWATFLGLFFFNYTFFFLITWLPSYLVNERHYTVRMMAIAGAIPFGATAIASLTGGWLSDRMIRNGYSVEKVRRRTAIAGLLLAGLTMPGATSVNATEGMIYLVIACIGIGIFTSNVWAMTQTLSGPLAAGKWTGIQNGIGNMGSLVAPIVTGWSVDRTGSFDTAFYLASGALLLSASMYAFVMKSLRPIDWTQSETA